MVRTISESDAVLDLLIQARRPGKRTVIGIAGPPGSGKSTLAEEVVERLNAPLGSGSRAVLLPMDGFHLDNEVLAARGLLARKGAPETFEAAGLVRLVRRVRDGGANIRYPLFDRTLDRCLTDAGLLKAETPIVVVEGNYLLLDAPPWDGLAGLFDATVFLAPSIETLEERLIERWLSFGFSPEEAAEKARGNDLKNARLVLEHSRAADLLLTQETEAT
ncbi:nucleoside triphosphate hydrolase [Halomonas sp. EGI 63088]|uniref:Nucleoside triphosphate hydrolase n=1 Tax=Halomonas flagellata TaxID=2920385 RepID=A0ABS9RW11_9GAMM|nr:nucleoside triphosphate hydrolase [Halomonas flagellata]MCH4564036.1 nucleoside triphosphate hydrolase [Halomonas flagellata]